MALKQDCSLWRVSIDQAARPEGLVLCCRAGLVTCCSLEGLVTSCSPEGLVACRSRTTRSGVCRSTKRRAARALLRSSSPRQVGLGFRVQGAGFRIQGAGCRVQGAGFRVQGSWCRVQGSGFRVQGAWCRVQGAGCVPPTSGAGRHIFIFRVRHLSAVPTSNPLRGDAVSAGGGSFPPWS